MMIMMMMMMYHMLCGNGVARDISVDFDDNVDDERDMKIAVTIVMHSKSQQ